MNTDIVTEFKRSLKGRVLIKEDVAPHTTFRIGGPADIWVEPSDVRDLKKALAFAREKRMPVFVMGGGSNILVNDSGIKGMVVHLAGPFFKKVNIKGAAVTAGAGYHISKLVRLCCENSLGGLESLVGIPGTLGGAVYMNAGGSMNPIFKNIGDFVTAVKAVDYNGNLKVFKKDNLKFGYRCSNLGSYIIVEVALGLENRESEDLKSRCSKFLTIKKQKQALDMRSAGCVFKNPKNSQFTCGQLIDSLGLKGMKMGGAEVSAVHANFIVNVRKATSRDVMRLIEFIREKVKANYNIALELEIKVIPPPNTPSFSPWMDGAGFAPDE